MATTDAAGLAAAIARQFDGGDAGARGPAPVERWNPPFCGDIDMEIRRDGSWFYGGTPIGRPALVRLFSTVLRRDEDGRTYLVTPVEKVGIRVEDAPFLAVGMEKSGPEEAPVITVRTNLGDVATIDSSHLLRFDTDDGLKPYVLIRGRLEALFSRALTYDLMALGETAEIAGEDMFVIRSSGETFPVMPMAKLEALS
nr:DUF1285 domain-containing protein [Martelella endophytica]